MKKLPRFLTTLLAAMLILLTACGPAATTAAPTAAPTTAVEPTEAPAPTEAPTTAADKVKVVWWHISTDDKAKAYWQSLADAYMADHPNVAIEITVLDNEQFKQKLATVMQSGEPPDLFQSWGGGVMNAYAEGGLLKDITSDIEGEWKDSFAPGPLAVYSYNGKQYGVPWDMGMVGFWYNKALFAQAGIDAPPKTWSELLDAVKKLKAAGITPIALGGKDKWPGHFWWVYLAVRLGGQPAFDKAYSRSGSFADETFVKAGEKLKELIDLEPFEDGFLGLGYNDQAALMGNGKAALELMGQWAPGAEAGNSENKTGIGEDLGFFPFPTVEGGVGESSDAMGGGNGIAVGKNAPPEAVDFLHYLTTADHQRAMAEQGLAVPVVKGAEDGIKDPMLKEVQSTLGQAKYFQLYYDQYLPPAVGDAVKDATEGLFAGTLSPEEAAQMIEDSASAELK